MKEEPSLEDIYIPLYQTTLFGKSAGDPQGFLILGIHGWSSRNGWHTWQPLMLPLAAAGYYVVSLDMPGWGSSPAIGSSPLNSQEASRILVEALDKLGRSSAILMGKSWGGGVATNIAVHYPTRVSHLLLTAPAIRDFDHIQSVNQPVLLAWAEDDTVIPIKNAELFVKAVPQSILVTYPTGGHSAAQKNAQDFADRALKLLRDSSL